MLRPRLLDGIRALTLGAPAYATRKKHIEDLEDRYSNILRSLTLAPA